MKKGDIVRIISGNYGITKIGTVWRVTNAPINNHIQIGPIPTLRCAPCYLPPNARFTLPVIRVCLTAISSLERALYEY